MLELNNLDGFGAGSPVTWEIADMWVSPSTLSATSVSRTVNLGNAFAGRVLVIMPFIWRNVAPMSAIASVTLNGVAPTAINTANASGGRSQAGTWISTNSTDTTATLAVTSASASMVMWGYIIFSLANANPTPYATQFRSLVSTTPYSLSLNTPSNGVVVSGFWNYFYPTLGTGSYTTLPSTTSNTTIWSSNQYYSLIAAGSYTAAATPFTDTVTQSPYSGDTVWLMSLAFSPN